MSVSSVVSFTLILGPPVPWTSNLNDGAAEKPIPKLPLGMFTFPPVLATKISAPSPFRLTLDVRPACKFKATAFEIV